MKNRRRNGVCKTKKDRRNVGDKVIVSNRSTGNTGRHKGIGKLKSQEAMARLKMVKDFIAQKSKFISPSEFAGNGKTIEIIDYSDADGKFGPDDTTHAMRETYLRASTVKEKDEIHWLLEYNPGA